MLLVAACLFLLSGCSGYTQEEVDSLVSEAAASASSESYDAGYEAGKETGYEEGFDAGIDAFLENPGDFVSSNWYCVPVDMEEQYWDTMNYYSWMCDYYGLPEYNPEWEGWDEFVFVHYVPPQENELPRMFYSTQDIYYHSYGECQNLAGISSVHLISENNAIENGYDPCPTCVQ